MTTKPILLWPRRRSDIALHLDRHKPSEKPDLERLDPVLREHHKDGEALLAGAAEALRPSLDDRERAISRLVAQPAGSYIDRAGERNRYHQGLRVEAKGPDS